MDIKSLKYYKIIGQIQTAVDKSTSLEEALKAGTKIILDSLTADYAIMWYLNKEDNLLHPYYWIGPNDLTSVSYKQGEGIIGKVIETNDAIHISDIRNDKAIKANDIFNDSLAILAVPFSNNQFEHGCIEFINTVKSGDFTEDEIDMCQILSLMTEIAINDNSALTQSWTKRNVLMTVRDIEKEYINGEVTTKVLKGVNLDVFEGEFLCFLGESGCGKSTLLNIIGGMDKADKGIFTFMGKDYSKSNENELTKYRRDNIGFIFQSYNLMPNLNSKENLDLIGELVDDPFNSLEALKLVGMDEKANNYPSQLSGGQQQRISIARALVKKPKLILADEPTAALDYATSIEVLTALEDVVKQGTTLIMVTHNEEITRMADRVIRFRNGQTYEITINNSKAKATDLVW